MQPKYDLRSDFAEFALAGGSEQRQGPDDLLLSTLGYSCKLSLQQNLGCSPSPAIALLPFLSQPVTSPLCSGPLCHMMVQSLLLLLEMT